VTVPSTRIILLGRIAIERDGEAGPVAGLTGRRAETVFAYLAVEHRRSVSRDELATVLWPESLPDTWNAALRGVLSDVRRFLERSGLDPATTLLTEQGSLRLRLPDDAALDIDQAQTALRHGRELLAAGQPAAAANAALRAADAAALPFLAFLDEEWASDVRTGLDRLLLDALQLQTSALRQAGNPSAAIAAADRLVRADPYSEAAHRLRITVLGEAGDRVGAQKAYERCTSLLASELGMAPSRETDDALRAALDGTTAVAPALDLLAASPAPDPEEGASLSELTVLVVEDHDFQRRTTLTLLGGLGVRTLQDASDGAAALELLDAGAAPDVIICDLDMPGMDGVEFIRNVGERRLASAVIIASGLDARVLETVTAVSEGYGLEVLGAVSKPLTAAALGRLLRTYRRRPSSAEHGPVQASLDAELAAALQAGSLDVAFEPVVDLGNGRVAGVRALASEDSVNASGDPALARLLTELLVQQARDAASGVDLLAFVRLPVSLLTDVSLADTLAAITRERIVLVVEAAAAATETDPAMLDLFARLRIKGYGLCIDGLAPGAGERLPLTHARLPDELVQSAARTGDNSSLQRAIDGSRLAGLPLIGRAATLAEFEVLLRVGCSFADGPFLAEPVPAARVRELVDAWTAPPVAVDR
jgi:DNA-binding SARP family transcriptional activator/CheY-like chemotaxis protein